MNNVSARRGAARPGGVPLAASASGITLVVVLAWLTVGTTGLTVVISTWLLGVGLGRVFPAMRGPATWAGAVVGQVAIVLAGSAAAALISPTTQPAWVNVLILALPTVVAGVLLFAGRRAPSATMPSHWQTPLTVVVAVLFIAWLIGRRGDAYDVAWAMSGDARNHAMIMRSIMWDGGVSVAAFRAYPAVANAFAGVIAGTAGRAGTPGALLLDDAHAMATVYLLTAMAVAVLLAGAVIAMVRSGERGRGSDVRAQVVALVAGAGAVTALVLGTALVDGFFSGYVALAMALAGVVFSVEAMTSRRPAVIHVVGAGAATLVTLVSWTVLVIVPAAALAVVVLRLLRHRPAPQHESLWPRRVGVVVGAGSLVLVVGAVALSMTQLRSVFAYPGSVRIPSPYLLPVLGLVALALWWASARTDRPATGVPVAITGVSAVVLFWLATLGEGDGLAWTYYGGKTYWLVVSSLFWVPFVPLARWAARTDTEPGPVRRAAAATAVAIAMVIATGSTTTSPEPLRAAANGWTQPSAAMVAEAVTAANSEDRFAFWQYSDLGNDKLGNFWAALVWAVEPDGDWKVIAGAEQSFPLWAYFQDTTQVDQLCILVRSFPGIAVITSNPDLDVVAECGVDDAAVILED